MTEKERELSWDDEIQQDKDFVLLPKGEYPFTAKAVERARHTGSDKLPPCNTAVVHIEVDGGDYGSTIIKHRLYLHSKCEGMICAFFRAIGLRQHGERFKMNWNAVAGRSGRCKVDTRRFEGKDYNEIKAFLDPAAPKTTPTTTEDASWKAGTF